MSPETVGWIGIAAMLVMVGVGVPVAYAMGIVGFLGSLALLGSGATQGLMELVPFATVASYSFGIVPLFVIMGYLVYYAGFANGAFATARIWIGHRTGGVPMASVLGCAVFGAASGSGLASTATLSRITIPEMIASGVDKRLAYGVVAAAGPLAQMIPPSILMIIYAIIAEQPAGKMLIAGIAPAFIIVVAYMVTIYIRVRRDPSLAPSLPRAGWSERFLSLRDTWGIAALAVFVIGGIYTGFFTPTEAGAVGASWALFLAIISRKLTWPKLRESIRETIQTTSMVFLIVIGAFIFGQFLAVTRLPTSISSWIVDLPVAPIVVILGIVVFYLILGLFIDMVAAMFITLPILLPAIVQLGYDPIWFGVLVVFLAEIALATPPFGLGLFIINGTIEGSKLSDICIGAVPFIIADLLILAVLVLWPELVMFLPNLM